jgi:hypothetical protein
MEMQLTARYLFSEKKKKWRISRQCWKLKGLTWEIKGLHPELN